ncbi:MAG: ATP-binding protein, partial [Alphaproteobacteria bacterium]|nr:ATP-binding protein [Alphaproteobacteria bacterium]
MLVEFSVGNYRSFANRQTLSMAASSAAENKKNVSFPTGNNIVPYLLRSACMFGPNASGKTSFVQAIDFFSKFVVSSSKESQEGEKIPANPFRLSVDFLNKPTEFEIIFIHKERYYQYGFAIDKERVWEEWLFSRKNIKGSRMIELFQRTYLEEENRYKWEINKKEIKGKSEFWKEATRDNALFLSTAVQLKSQTLKVPFTWIQEHLRTIESTERLSPSFSLECIKKGKKKEILNFIQSADICISDIEAEKKKISHDLLPSDMPDELKKEIITNFEDANFYRISTYHKGKDGKKVTFDISEESDGTKVLLSLAGPWLDVLEAGATVIIDELHNSLHPHALKFLVKLFNDPETNKNNAQLIFTSHETSVMTKGFMHRDQIW